MKGRIIPSLLAMAWILGVNSPLVFYQGQPWPGNQLASDQGYK